MDGSPAARRSGIDPLAAVRLLRAAGAELGAQAVLHGRLAWIEWQEEQGRLLKMLVLTLAAFVFLLCALMLVSGLLLAAAWATPWRLPLGAGLVLAHALAGAAAWARVRAWAARGEQAFAATREELAADARLLAERR